MSSDSTKGRDDYENSGNDDSSDEAEREETEGQQGEGDAKPRRRLNPRSRQRTGEARRGQQEGDRSETATPGSGRDHCRDREGDRLAEPQHPGIPQRAGDEEDEAEGRVNEERGGRADLPDRDVAKARTFHARAALGIPLGRLFSFWFPRHSRQAADTASSLASDS